MSTRIPALRRLAPVALLLVSTNLRAQAPPATDALAKLVPEGTFVYVQAPSLDRIGEVATKLAKLFGPDGGKTPRIDDLLAQMNMPGAAKEIDHQRPIGLCVVLPAQPGSEPRPTFLVPTVSAENFVRSIAESRAKWTTAIEGGYVSVSEGPGSKHGPAPAPIAMGLPPGELVVRIDIESLVDHFRPMIEMGLGQLETAMESTPPKATGGMDIQPLLKLYMEGARAFLDSGQRLDLALRLDGNRLEIASDLAMIENSPLTGFGSKRKTDARSLARFVDPDASITMVVGMDQAAMMKQFKPVIDALVSVYPAPLRAGLEKMMTSADELCAEIGSAMCVSGDFGPTGLRFVNYVHPHDAAKLVAIYGKMLGSMPSASLDEPKEGELDGVHVTRTRLHVDSKAFFENKGKDLPEEANAKLMAMFDKVYGKDGLALAFATKGDLTAIVVGGDEAYLRAAVGRFSSAGKPAPGIARALDQVGDLSPCFALQYNLGKMMHGIQDLAGEELPGMPPSVSNVSTTFTYWGGIDGRVWRGAMSLDLAELGAAVHAMKGEVAR